MELHQHLLAIIISVVHDKMVPQASTTPCGMEKGVAATPAVPTTTLPGSTDSSHTQDVEMRLCRDEDRSNEDTVIKTVEIYIQ